MYQKIINPNTNRPVCLFGRIGRQVLDNYIHHFQTGGADSDSDQPEKKTKIRLDDGVEFEYFKTLEEAESTVGVSYNIAEMPDNSYIYLQGETYRIKGYDNKGYIICYRLGSQNQVLEKKSTIKLDATMNVLYLGATPTMPK